MRGAGKTTASTGHSLLSEGLGCILERTFGLLGGTVSQTLDQEGRAQQYAERRAPRWGAQAIRERISPGPSSQRP